MGETDELLRDEKDRINKVFEDREDLTLVIAFDDSVESIGDKFAYYLNITNLKKISFSGRDLMKVGCNFFSGARLLTSVDFRGLSAM